jgi:hypothetical protein
MINYSKALRATGVGIVLSLLWFAGCLLYLWFMYEILRLSSNAHFVLAIFIGISIVAVVAFGLIGGWLRGKPHVVYASVHGVCWMSFVGPAVLTGNPFLFIGPLVGSILLFLLLQPILAFLSKIDAGVPNVPKEAARDPLTYTDGYRDNYKKVQSETMYTESKQYYPSPNQEPPLQSPQSYH